MNPDDLDETSIEDLEEKDKFTCKDLKTFEAGFWLLAFDFMISYAMTITAVIVGTKHLVKRFGFAEN